MCVMIVVCMEDTRVVVFVWTVDCVDEDISIVFCVECPWSGEETIGSWSLCGMWIA